ncbi:L,D-transpeptidase [Secundilactobacillus malefermentans]|nr:L,D-transpeptidase [Secundilactobacillus malefermentans]
MSLLLKYGLLELDVINKFKGGNMKRLLKFLMVIFVLGMAAFFINRFLVQPHQAKVLQQQTEKLSQTKNTKKVTKPINVNWHKSSQKKAYPNFESMENPWFKVSIKDQRVYVMDGSELKYTMYCSTGKGKSTPTGTYTIQSERGDSFYNQQSGEGANYWVSWKDHGVYLFHSVPVDKNGNYIKSEADRLGKEANSHGCVRLTIADAKWVYENVPYGMKVVITNS